MKIYDDENYGNINEDYYISDHHFYMININMRMKPNYNTSHIINTKTFKSINLEKLFEKNRINL